jgi:hypothetical protein
MLGLAQKYREANPKKCKKAVRAWTEKAETIENLEAWGRSGAALEAAGDYLEATRTRLKILRVLGRSSKLLATWRKLRGSL